MGKPNARQHPPLEELQVRPAEDDHDANSLCYSQVVGAELVSVGWGECGDDGEKVMMASSLPSLRSLDISDNNISEAGLDLCIIFGLDKGNGHKYQFCFC